MKAGESMEKHFQKELLDNAQFMTEEEIGSAVERLIKYRAWNFHNNVRKKHELAVYCEGGNESFRAELGFIGEGKNKQGSMSILGVSLLKEADFHTNTKVTKISNRWWLQNGGCVITDGAGTVDIEHCLRPSELRPVIIIKNIKGDLEIGDYFYINSERFRLISEYLAIRTEVLKGIWSGNPKYGAGWRYCIEGWYLMMIRENPQWCEDNGISQTV